MGCLVLSALAWSDLARREGSVSFAAQRAPVLWKRRRARSSVTSLVSSPRGAQDQGQGACSESPQKTLHVLSVPFFPRSHFGLIVVHFTYFPINRSNFVSLLPSPSNFLSSVPINNLGHNK